MRNNFIIQEQSPWKFVITEIDTELISDSLNGLFLFDWTGQYSGDNLLNDLGDDYITVTDRDWDTDYIPDTSEAVFSIPDTQEYSDADTDSFWTGGVVVDDLIGLSPQRTFVKYSNTEPYNIDRIAILRSDVVLTEQNKIDITEEFELWVQYWGLELMEQGYMKDNRILEE